MSHFRRPQEVADERMRLFPPAGGSCYPTRVKVQLLDDLTRYHPSLKAGVEGMTVPPAGMWARSSDRFCSVQFPAVTLDVLWRGLQITDSTYLALEKELTDVRDAAIAAKTVSAERRVGPRGGFRGLTVIYEQDGERRTHYTGSKDEARRVEKLVAKSGVEVVEVKER